MRILFDKNVPYPLLRYLGKHDVRTAEELGWAWLVNGDLLRAAEDAGFGVMVTADQSLEYQQNLKGRMLALVVLGSGLVNDINEFALQRAEAAASLWAFWSAPFPPGDVAIIRSLDGKRQRSRRAFLCRGQREKGTKMTIDTEIRHVTKPGTNLFLELGFDPGEAKASTGCVPQTHQ